MAIEKGKDPLGRLGERLVGLGHLGEQVHHGVSNRDATEGRQQPVPRYPLEEPQPGRQDVSRGQRGDGHERGGAAGLHGSHSRPVSSP